MQTQNVWLDNANTWKLAYGALNYYFFHGKCLWGLVHGAGKGLMEK